MESEAKIVDENPETEVAVHADGRVAKAEEEHRCPPICMEHPPFSW